MYCKKCGGKVDSYASHCPFCGEPVANNGVEATYRTSDGGDGSYKSIGSWIATYIIMCLPLIGFIMLFVWAFGKKTLANRTFRNWARALLLVQVIVYVVSIVASVVLVILVPDFAQKFADAMNAYIS